MQDGSRLQPVTDQSAFRKEADTWKMNVRL